MSQYGGSAAALFSLCLVLVQPWKIVNWDVKNLSKQTNIPAKPLSQDVVKVLKLKFRQ